MTVTVYSTGPDCMQCNMTCRLLEAQGVDVHRVELADEQNAAALEYVTEELGYSGAPVVVVEGEPESHWSGFQPDLIKRLSARLHELSVPT
nr:glutaredoxin family protein [Microbacterium sulfonylureivorans]